MCVYVCVCLHPSFTQLVYVTVLAPYLGFFILIINGAMLDGAQEGLNFLFRLRDWQALTDGEVRNWRFYTETVTAACQILFRLIKCNHRQIA